MSDAVNFQLNGKTVSLIDAEPTQSLLRWLKQHHLTGTKEGCADGDCGACTVAVVEIDAGGKARYQAINSCLLPVGCLPGREVITVEALAQGATLHPVQSALVESAGSQCGYCTPGFVMSLFAGYYSGELGDSTIEGNLCRCTGYAPIRNAAQKLAAAPPAADAFSRALGKPRNANTFGSCKNFFNPLTVDEALALKAEHLEAMWIAGATDLGVNLSHGQDVAQAFIALDRIKQLHTLTIDDDAVYIGAAVTLSQIEHQLLGVFPALDLMLPWFAGRQVRNRATFGGNLGTASPIGDLPPILLALDAQIELRSVRGSRSVDAAQYFHGYRKTERAQDELIVGVTVPRRTGLLNAAYKVAKRQTDDISIVAAVFALACDADHVVRHARLAYGGVAAVPLRAIGAEKLLLGKTLNASTVAVVVAQLESEFVPISDHRAGADYRRRLAGSLFARFVDEHAHCVVAGAAT